MSGELFFNGRDWRDKGFNEQQVKFLELLYNRAGGAQAPELNLSEVSNMVSNIIIQMNSILSDNDKLRRRIQELENAL